MTPLQAGSPARDHPGTVNARAGMTSRIRGLAQIVQR